MLRTSAPLNSTLGSMNLLRVVGGAVVAPLAIPAIYLTYGLCCSGYPYTSPGHMEKFITAGLPSIAALSYFASFAIGLPMVLVLGFLKAMTIRNCTSFGAILGGAATFAFCYANSGPDGRGALSADLGTVLGGTIAALLIASIFCVVAGVQKHAVTNGTYHTNSQAGR